MRINWDTPMEELYHSDNVAYIDLDEDEICHWKYIKRVKLPNGKWRYFYDQSELEQYMRIADRANNAVSQSRNEVQNARANLDRAEAELSDAVDRVSKRAKASGMRGIKAPRVDRAIDKYNAAKEKVYKAEKVYEHAIAVAADKERKYNRKKIVSFPARTIAKGAVMVANFFSGTNEKPKIKKPKKKKVSRVTYSSSVSLKSVQ